MPRKSKTERLAEIHATALQQFEDSYTATSTDREWARMARRFVNIRGAQWDWDEDNQFRNRMKMEIDKIGLAVTRVKNEYRRNRISAKFLPKDGSDADMLADACAGRFRADTMDASGREARDTAFDCSTEGGYAGLRLRAEYEDGDKQRICLEAVNDPEATLFFDVNAKRKDKSDAGHGFLVTPWSRRAFEAEYGEDASSWPEHLKGKYTYQWFGSAPEFVMVAEYFVKEKRTDRYRVFEGFGGEKEEFLEDEVTDEDIDDLTAMGFTEIESREEEVDQVCKYVMNGAKVLSGPEKLPGREIPLIPQYGHRVVIDHVERFKGKVLPGVDSQILYNLEVSKVAETAASSSVEKPIFTPRQILAHAERWQNDHIENNAFMMVDPLIGPNGEEIAEGPVGYTKSPDIPASVSTLIELTRQDISDQMGNPENAEQVEPDVSGVAMELIQGRIDMQSYIFMDGAADAERRMAEIWLSMASEVYVEDGRKLKTLDENGRRGQVEIGRKILTKDGKVESEIDFSKARFDVEVEVGPTSASRRAAIVKATTGIMGAGVDPETQVMLGHVALMNMEGEGLQDVRDYSRKRLVAMGVVKPTKEEQADIEAAKGEQQPDPNAVLADALSKESEAKALKATADAGLAVARTKQAEAETAETIAGIPIAQQESAVKTAKQIAEGVTPNAG